MMLQALVTLLFAGMAVCAAGAIAGMLRQNWDAITFALGIRAEGGVQQPLPPRYRSLPARRAAMMTIREAPPLRAAA